MLDRSLTTSSTSSSLKTKTLNFATGTCLVTGLCVRFIKLNMVHGLETPPFSLLTIHWNIRGKDGKEITFIILFCKEEKFFVTGCSGNDQKTSHLFLTEVVFWKCWGAEKATVNFRSTTPCLVFFFHLRDSEFSCLLLSSKLFPIASWWAWLLAPVDSQWMVSRLKRCSKHQACEIYTCFMRLGSNSVHGKCVLELVTLLEGDRSYLFWPWSQYLNQLIRFL